MKFDIYTGDLEKLKTDCLVVGIYENQELTSTAKRIDKLAGNYLSSLLKQGEIQGKVGDTLMLFNVPGINAKRILLVGCGKHDNHLSDRNFRKIVFGAVKILTGSKTQRVISCLTEVAVEKQDLAWKVSQTVELTLDALYQFSDYKSEKPPKVSLQEFSIHIAQKNKSSEADEALTQGLAIAAGVTYTKNLANQPSNVCTPTYLADSAKQLAKQFKTIKATVLEESDMKKLGMNAILAVAKGSEEDAKLICLEYKGAGKKQAPVAFVGKGVTFDTGGISLKPADSMVGMKYDMCGAATVLGVLRTAAELKLPVNLVGIIATVENMPSGTAVKPEDIVTTMSGQTVEIMNTDAEGRLILCDALTYCERFKPETVIDIATLTGAVVIALGHQATGLLANHQPLADELLKAGNQTYDRAWQLPLWDEYQELLKSPFADMSNVGGRAGGTITAACFLSRFAKKFHWAHLDVAGTAAMMGGNDRYATGRPVPMLVQFLLNRCEK